MLSRTFLIERFGNLVASYEDSDDGIRDFLLEKGEEVLKSDIIKEVWAELTDKSKSSVLEYGKVLRETAMRYKTLSNEGKSQPSIAEIARGFNLSDSEKQELEELFQREVQPFLHASMTGDRTRLTKMQKEALQLAEEIVKEFEKERGRGFDPSNREDIEALKEFQKLKIEQKKSE